MQLNVESIIRAPVSGTVLELLVNEGDPVVPLTSYQAGTALTTLADMSQLVFKGTVDEIDVGKLHEGMPARIKVGAMPDAAVEGTVYKIAPKSKTAEGATLFDVEIELLPGGGSRSCARATPPTPTSWCARRRTCCSPRAAGDVRGRQGHGRGPAARATASRSKKEIKVGLSDGINVEVAEG